MVGPVGGGGPGSGWVGLVGVQGWVGPGGGWVQEVGGGPQVDG